MNHNKDHVEKGRFYANCEECARDSDAIDWVMAVRKFGLEKANEMFEDKR